MKVTLQVERHYVAAETDYKSSNSRELFDMMIKEVVRKMDLILAKESEAEK